MGAFSNAVSKPPRSAFRRPPSFAHREAGLSRDGRRRTSASALMPPMSSSCNRSVYAGDARIAGSVGPSGGIGGGANFGRGPVKFLLSPRPRLTAATGASPSRGTSQRKPRTRPKRQRPSGSWTWFAWPVPSCSLDLSLSYKLLAEGRFATADPRAMIPPLLPLATPPGAEAKATSF